MITDRFKVLASFGAIALMLSLGACGGGGVIASASGPVVPAPPPSPAPSPSPSPTPVPPPTAALVAPVQTSSPASPVAVQGGATFGALQRATVFPLLETTVETAFSGDATTTANGATLSFDDGRLPRLSVGNPQAGITDAAAGAKLTEGDRLTLRTANDNLNYLRYGDWTVQRFGGVDMVDRASAWTAGFVTPLADIPTDGSARYQGQVLADYSRYLDSCECPVFAASMKGDIALSVDFASRSVSGAVTGLQLIDDFPFVDTVNEIDLTVTLDTSRNLFTGTTSVGLAPPSQYGGNVSIYAFGSNATGSVAGRFYGPRAEEVGGVLTLADATRRLIASFGAQR